MSDTLRRGFKPPRTLMENPTKPTSDVPLTGMSSGSDEEDEDDEVDTSNVLAKGREAGREQRGAGWGNASRAEAKGRKVACASAATRRVGVGEGKTTEDGATTLGADKLEVLEYYPRSHKVVPAKGTWPPRDLRGFMGHRLPPSDPRDQGSDGRQVGASTLR